MPGLIVPRKIRELLEEPGQFFPQKDIAAIWQESNPRQLLQVCPRGDGDMLITASNDWGSHVLRFREYFGGGSSIRTWSALRFLGLAIQASQDSAIDKRAEDSSREILDMLHSLRARSCNRFLALYAYRPLSRRHDDGDGDESERLRILCVDNQVRVTSDGDAPEDLSEAFVMNEPTRDGTRLVWNALIVLGMAMHLDNSEGRP